MNQGLWRKFVAEFLGTSALVFFGCGAIAVSATFELPELLWFVPLIFGATITFMIYGVGHLSGGHFNPAVTIAFALVKRLSPQAVLPYVLAQLFGALFGCLLILLLVPGAETYGATQPAIDWLPALGVEIVLSIFFNAGDYFRGYGQTSPLCNGRHGHWNDGHGWFIFWRPPERSRYESRPLPGPGPL